MSNHYLAPFVDSTARALSRAHDRVADQCLPWSVGEELRTEIRAALTTLVLEDAADVYRAALVVYRTRRRGLRGSCVRALALVQAPEPRYGRVAILRGERDE